MNALSPAQKRAMLAIAATLAVYVATVATHRGEFWPFSIYPMFSQAGKPWTRALVVELPKGAAVEFGTWPLDALPGTPCPTNDLGISTNDLSAMVKASPSWDEADVKTLSGLFDAAVEDGRTLLVLRSDGHYGDDGVQITATGLVAIGPSGTALNPTLAVAK